MVTAGGGRTWSHGTDGQVHTVKLQHLFTSVSKLYGQGKSGSLLNTGSVQRVSIGSLRLKFISAVKKHKATAAHA